MHLHLDGKIRPQLLFPLRMIHLPPVAGSLRLFKRQIIPAVHHLLQPEAVLRLNQLLRLKSAMLADAAADLQRHINGRIAEIQEIALPLHQRIGEISLPGPDDPRFPVQLPEILRLIFRAALIIDQIRMGHVFHQAVRCFQMIFLRQLINPVCERHEFRNLPPSAKVQIGPVIARRVGTLSVVLSGGIGREHRPVRLHVGEHHAQVPHRMVKIFFLPGAGSQIDHGIVVDAVVDRRRPLRVFSVFIAVDALRQVAFRSFRVFVLSKEIRAHHQTGGDHPAVVGRMEAAAQKPVRRVSGYGVHSVVDLLLISIPLPVPQIIQAGKQLLQIKARVRRGMEIALDQVKKPVLMLVPFHEGKPGKNPLCHPFVLKINALFIAVRRRHVL